MLKSSVYWFFAWNCCSRIPSPFIHILDFDDGTLFCVPPWTFDILHPLLFLLLIKIASQLSMLCTHTKLLSIFLLLSNNYISLKPFVPLLPYAFFISFMAEFVAAAWHWNLWIVLLGGNERQHGRLLLVKHVLWLIVVFCRTMSPPVFPPKNRCAIRDEEHPS